MLIGALLVLTACGAPDSDSGAQSASEASSATAKHGEEFGGKIARSYEESEEWWAPPVVPAEDAPNIIIFLLDDVGFAQVGSFGGLIDTPNIDRLASNGLRYNNFHTTALCSPSRATLMAGRANEIQPTDRAQAYLQIMPAFLILASISIILYFGLRFDFLQVEIAGLHRAQRRDPQPNDSTNTLPLTTYGKGGIVLP